jgi:poly(3-hydroxybutyrate) depolymerase
MSCGCHRDGRARPEPTAVATDADAAIVGETDTLPLTSDGGCGGAVAATGEIHLRAKDGAGRLRDFELLVPPPGEGSKRLAVTFIYHGAESDQAGALAFGLQDAPGAAAASIFVVPKGVPYQTYGVGWDDTCGGYDMVFFDRMLAYVERHYCVDEAAVFAAGFSWGADHVTALACCRGRRIRAVAAASCTDEYTRPDDYRSYADYPCPALGGTAVRFTHDEAGDGIYTKAQFTSTSALFAYETGCSGPASPVPGTACVEHRGCASSFVECAYPSLGHRTPPGWAAETWAFFEGVR